jgi:isopenicillin N synthase-like dioxygenase
MGEDRAAVPVIDIGPYFTGAQEAKRSVALQIDQACREIGFLVIAGHGVPDALVADMGAATRALFDLPAEIKRRYASSEANGHVGYQAVETNALANTLEGGGEAAPPDFREIFAFNRPFSDPPGPETMGAWRTYHPNLYPSEIPNFEAIVRAYYAAMESLAQTLMRLFALALDLEETWFDDKIDRHLSNFNLSNYPDQLEPPRPGQLRAGAHTDFGSLTILKAEDAPGGLEVQTADGRWQGVPIVPGAFIINIGDLMARWTNDRWVSTLHRVVNPPRDKALGSRRQSLIFFHQPNDDAIVECLASCLGGGLAKYPPISSGEHLVEQLRKMRAI